MRKTSEAQFSIMVMDEIGIPKCLKWSKRYRRGMRKKSKYRHSFSLSCGDMGKEISSIFRKEGKIRMDGFFESPTQFHKLDP